MESFQRYIHDKQQKIGSFFKDSNVKYLNFSYITAFVVFIFLLSFQNCKTTDIDTAVEGSGLPGSGSIKEPSYDVGQIVELDIKNGETLADRLLPLKTDVKFQLFNVDPTSDSYKWTIQRGFDSVLPETSISTSTYQTKFSKSGAHDVFASSYKSTELKTRASKRFIIGASCLASDILEIELLSETAASFKIGESGSATFVLKDSDSFSSIQWKATTLPSGQVVTNDDGVDTLTVDLSSETTSGSLVIEVSAENTQRSGCLTYRKKEVIVTSNTRPYFNPLSFTDGSNNVPVTLENNDIYKFTRPKTTRFIEIEVLNAESCQYQANDGNAVNFSCDGELIQIPSSSGTDCISATITLIASNSHGESHSQSYYYYCGENDTYCYFGLVSQQVGSQICPIQLASSEDGKGPDIQFQKRSDFEVDPSSGRCGTTQNICQIGTLKDVADTETHYQWQCVGTGSTADCQDAKVTVLNSTTTTTQKIIGRCGSYQGDSDASCAAGNFHNDPGHTNTQYRWTCRSIPHTTPNREVECSEAKPTPPATQRPRPPATQRPRPPATQRPRPPATQRPRPPATQRPRPPATQRPRPPATQRPTPPATQRPTPPATQRPRPPATQRPTPPATQRPTPPATQRPTPPVIQRPTPPATQRPTPPATQRPTPPVIQRPTPPATQRPTPPATQRPTPPATQRPTPPATQRPTPPATQRPTPPATQRPTPPATQRPRPPATQRPRPPATQRPRPPATQRPPTTRPPDPCAGVSCSNDKVCRNGSCVCPGQCCPFCKSGQVCTNGSCVNRKGGGGNRPINCDNDDHNDLHCQGP